MEIIVATCNDRVRNNGEIGIDCDGPCVKRCNGAACSSRDDCWSGVCGTNQTCSVPMCSDNIQNGLEAGVDCGWGCPLQCESQFCTLDIDCKSSVCWSQTCQ
ncbi:unnamed protein product, partial [Rotaria sp. Silwood2]